MLVGKGFDFGGILDWIRSARRHGGVSALSNVARGDLVSEVRNGLWGRADPDEAGIEDRLSELGVLGEEAIAGVDSIGAGLSGGVEKLGEVEVRLRGGLAAERKGFIGKRYEWGVGIGLGVDRYRWNARVAGRPDDADRNLTAVGHEDLGDVLGFNCHGRNPPP